MRLIDADALICSLDEEPIVWLSDEYATGLRDQWRIDISAIKAAPTIGGWISVKDRLPEKNGDYLVYTRDGIIWPYYFTASSCVWNDALGYSTDTVTHWMPLPEPPEEGG